jgi:hypothetical protein
MRCPVCKADNNDSPQCRRCRADLTLLVALEQCRARALSEAVAYLGRGDGQSAQRAAIRGDRLRRDEESERLVAMARLLTGEYPRAFAWYEGRRSLGVRVEEECEAR